MKKLFKIATLGSLFFTGCAGVNWNTIGSDVIKDVQSGAIAAQDAYNAYNAVNQQLTTANVTTGKLTVAKVITAYTAGASALNTPGLVTAVGDFVNDAQATISDLKATGASTPAIIKAVSQQGAATVTTVSAISGS